MTLESKNIQKIYSGKLAMKYDFSMPHSFNTWKRKAIEDSSLKQGDRVLVFCCGTGADFPAIQKKIGRTGNIVGIDFSSEMLQEARKKVRKNKWGNVELVRADVTQYLNRLDLKADVGMCTLGMSIIPDYKEAYTNLISNIKSKGEVIIGDMQLASGWLARLNPITILMSKRYGGTYEGHNNSLKLIELMKRDLMHVRKKEFFLSAYYFCIGTKK